MKNQQEILEKKFHEATRNMAQTDVMLVISGSCCRGAHDEYVFSLHKELQGRTSDRLNTGVHIGVNSELLHHPA